MELILGLIGTITGVFALITSIVTTLILYYKQKREKEELERRHEREKEELERRQAELERKQDEKDRLAFLSNVIFDTTIPRESRQAFYDEYISKQGNGPVVRFWLLEGAKEKIADKTRQTHE